MFIQNGVGSKKMEASTFGQDHVAKYINQTIMPFGLMQRG